MTLAAVACTWEEPNTQGLHYAQYWPLDAKKARGTDRVSNLWPSFYVEDDYAPSYMMGCLGSDMIRLEDTRCVSRAFVCHAKQAPLLHTEGVLRAKPVPVVV